MHGIDFALFVHLSNDIKIMKNMLTKRQDIFSCKHENTRKSGISDVVEILLVLDCNIFKIVFIKTSS